MPFLDTLRSLDAKATPSPWSLTSRSCDIGCCDNIQRINAQYPEDVTPDRDVGSMNGGNAVWLRSGETEANAPLVTLLRNHAARIAAVVEAAQSLVFALPDAHMSIRVGGDKPEIEALRAALAALEAP